ncbi:EF-P lysine aminoacylase EpmA [Pelobacter propionicus]|uniref:tRNA synthetase, class II (D, K and N) n=1 Tax=Pelobacter propionicus (strain DSM 2379 / NBRC 103807 / OttBd1) TaxID=338966 RepID=A1APV6_PELPD|nr:EF-P lysine aminoacylase EpmA [Pelobacter propionicus]ABK99376.1 tRNA synthetase, class II (D, K and N) [Pelobacter propionicus DSM 2379]
MHPRDHNLYLRADIVAAIRSFFASRRFLEVDTPHLIPANAPEEYIDPHGSGDRYLHTSPEICMKRLLCRGHERIFQICRCWRRDERGSRHLPEFAMLEWYRRDSDYRQLMEDCQELLRWVALICGKSEGIDYQGQRLEPCREAQRITVRDAYARYAVKDVAVAVVDGTFDELMVTRIESSLPTHVPVILMDYPAEMASLARLKADDESVAERFELYLGGLELANGFSELNDPREQRQRFLVANERRIEAGLSPLPLPEPFLDELASLPPSAGIALGIDRLVMLFADAPRIDDVISFTPEEL